MTGDDGQRLYSWWRRPPRVRGVVWYVLGPEAGAQAPYPRFTAALCDAGFAVALVHPRGTGCSPGRRGDVDDVGVLLRDCHGFRAEIERRLPAVPLFLLGHSAGAAFAAELAATATPRVDGVLLVNPAYRLRATAGMTPTWREYLSYAVSWLFRPSAPSVDMNSRPGDVAFGPDREEAIAMQRDPAAVRYFSIRMLLALRRLMRRLPANVAALDVPVLLVQGAHDALVDPRSNDAWFAGAKAAGSVTVIAPDGGHGASAVETVAGTLVQWLDEQVGRLASRGTGTSA